ncbi:BolA/IbaG family iron-sulfur metabolism protein [Celerinatantimonas sp. YJH-8]|uniref:BolA/IbaG family iron-sulfur metabolism protein n=1 Tax=Celerinatantimonas sp. YJH-8 TaxID=3228714 RepID=UPI0038C34D45
MSIEAEIQQRLERDFSPSYLHIENESYRHHVPAGSESHFKVAVVSEQFEGKRLLLRHKQVHACLVDLLSGPVHALALHTFTPQEWVSHQQIPDSPNCRGS